MLSRYHGAAAEDGEHLECLCFDLGLVHAGHDNVMKEIVRESFGDFCAKRHVAAVCFVLTNVLFFSTENGRAQKYFVLADWNSYTRICILSAAITAIYRVTPILRIWKLFKLKFLLKCFLPCNTSRTEIFTIFFFAWYSCCRGVWSNACFLGVKFHAQWHFNRDNDFATKC